MCTVLPNNAYFLLTVIIPLLPFATPQPPTRPPEAQRPPRGGPPQNVRPPQYAGPPRPYHDGQFQYVENAHRGMLPPPPPNWNPQAGNPLPEWTPRFEGPLYRDGPEQLDILPNPAGPPRMRAPPRPGGPPANKARPPQMNGPSYPPSPWSDLKDRPVIGMLSEASKLHIKNYGNDYVKKEYIKFIEMAGAYVLLVQAGQPLKYYTDIFPKINGLFLPGGGAALRNSTFAESIRIFLDLSIKANDKGDYFPIWGTCLGFEIMAIQAAGMYAFNMTDSANISLPLTLSPSYKTTRMLGNAPQEIIDYLTQENTTAHFHIMSLLTETYNREERLNKFYRIVSTNKGRDGLDFVSTIEAHNYPFFAVQWHPEKPIFLRRPDLAIPTSEHAVKIGQYFANFFISEARKSNHTFSSDEERAHAVVGDNDPYCLPKEVLKDICSGCSCCKKEPQHTWSTDLCLVAVSLLCMAFFVLYVWPTLYIFPSAKEISMEKCK